MTTYANFLTPDELNDLLSQGDKRSKNGLRKGQNFMITLYELNPEIYKRILGTEVDPFYDDSRLELFFQSLVS